MIVQDGEVVGGHARVFGRDQTIRDPRRCVPALDRRPGASRDGAPFKAPVPAPAMARVQTRLAGASGGDRQTVAPLVAAHENGVEAVERACAAALEAGLRSADAILDTSPAGAGRPAPSP